MAKKVLAFDFGASTGRAILGGIEDGRLVYSEVSRFDNNPVCSDGALRWDFDALLKNVLDAIKKAGDFDAIGIDTWGVDYGVIDGDGKLAAAPVHYRDKRTEGVPERVFKKISEKKLYAESGITPMRINTMFQLYREFVEDGAAAEGRTMLLMPDLFAYFLTGAKRAEITIASTTGLLDKSGDKWNDSLIKKLKLPRGIFPELIKAGESYGNLKSGLCSALGVKSVPVVAVCTHDTASAAAVAGGGAYISSGTWSLAGTTLTAPNTENPAFTNERGLSGVTYLENIMGMWLSQQIRAWLAKDGVKPSWKELDAIMLAAKQPSALIDPNAPELELPENMESAIRGFCLKTGQTPPATLGELLLCVNNSLACRYRKTVEGLEKITGKPLDCINIVGGGSGNAYLCARTADVTGKRVEAGPSEATAVGNICVQLAALGEISVSEIRELVTRSESVKIYEPRPSAELDAQYEKFLRIEGK